MRRTEPAREVRIVHLGLGNFVRAHLAWYTEADPDWGIAAFSGRSTELAAALTANDGLYNLVVRTAEGDEPHLMTCLSEAHPGTDETAYLALMSRPETAILSLTVTEAAYPGIGTRIAAGLAARRAAGAGPITVLSLDNLPGNGEVTRQAVLAASGGDAALQAWVTANVAFPTSMVDRITPATTGPDPTEVVTEPFTEWVISGDFPAGRPSWEKAGARFTDDVEPHEHRKLWLLNGGHSLLAYAGGNRGHATVAEAVADPGVRNLLDQWWNEAARHLSVPADEIAAYREALLDRWANPRIQHRLAQIGTDGSQKLPIRILPVLRLDRTAGNLPEGAVQVLASWIGHLRGAGVPVNDPPAAALGPDVPVTDALALLDPALAADSDLVRAVQEPQS